jgi:hypothetical protein
MHVTMHAGALLPLGLLLPTTDESPHHFTHHPTASWRRKAPVGLLGTAGLLSVALVVALRLRGRSRGLYDA